MLFKKTFNQVTFVVELLSFKVNKINMHLVNNKL